VTPTNVLLARWQFGVTTTYHFLFVPLTIGLAFLVAIMQAQAYRTKDETWERLTRFFGTLFLINFAMGIVTGIVQEFQFGAIRGPEHRLRGNDPLHGVQADGALGEQAADRVDLVDGAAGVEGLGAHRLAGREPRAVAGGDGRAPGLQRALVVGQLHGVDRRDGQAAPAASRAGKNSGSDGSRSAAAGTPRRCFCLMTRCRPVLVRGC
jgi:hypothetical protein